MTSGAFFIRSLTLYFVDKQTLKEFVYLEHGAHYAIGFLAIIMFAEMFVEIPEIVTGSIGMLFIVASFVQSVCKKGKR